MKTFGKLLAHVVRLVGDDHGLGNKGVVRGGGGGRRAQVGKRLLEEIHGRGADAVSAENAGELNPPCITLGAFMAIRLNSSARLFWFLA